MSLSLKRFHREHTPPVLRGAHAEIVAGYGLQHEQAVLEKFDAEGRTIERFATGPKEEDLRRARGQTRVPAAWGVPRAKQRVVGRYRGGARTR
jgi:hypothetical protein